MCGIAGLWWFERNHPVDIRRLKMMCDAIKHRGPDDEGFFVDGNIGLGHRRLSILDLSPAGHQPMSNEDQNIWLTFNGEIYNYLELLPQLKSKGHKFKSHTDSEVIIHAYEEYGENCVEHFNGMWAFALWDRAKQKLFLSRDRFGVKPLYYFLDNKVVCFASEIKSILTHFPELNKPSQAFIYRFLTTGVLFDSHHTFFDQIESLPPAHSMTVDSSGTHKIKRHWAYDRDRAHSAFNYANPEETFRELLKDAVKLRLRSDAPVGTCLSGGLDSSSIVALMSREIDEPVRTFSALYDEPDCDERQYVEIMNNRFNTLPFQVYPKSDNLFEILPEIVWFQDAPSAGPGLYSQWHVMQEAQGKVKVLLDGQGGDELLGGYFRYFDHYLISLLAQGLKTRDYKYFKLFVKSWRDIQALTNRPQMSRFLTMFLKQLLQTMESPIRPLLEKLTPLNKVARSRYGSLHSEFISSVQGGRIKSKQARKLDSLLNTVLHNDLTATSIPTLLHYEDRNSMAFSIEARTPFLDYRLVEFSMGLPFTEKINGSTTKHILRRALADILPEQIVNRSDKKGYPTPFAGWLRQDRCEQAKEILLSAECRRRKIFNHRILEQSLEKHANGELDLSWEIWRLLTTEIWFKQFIDRAIGTPGREKLSLTRY